MASAPPPAQTHPYRILLIEDDPLQAATLRQLLEGGPPSRFVVAAEARTLGKGLHILATDLLDIVLLDLSLPDSGGLETFSRLHAAFPLIPVIVLTGVDDDELALEAVHLGAQEYLVKSATDGHSLRRALRYAMERSRAEAELARERDLVQTLLENIPDRIYFKDRRSRFTRINHALTQLFQLGRPDDAYGKTDADFYGDEHAKEALEDERRVMETGEPIINKIEKEELSSGRRSWSLTSKLPLRDRSGRIIGTCGISREITELKEMEEQLAAERYVLRSVIDNLPDLIYLKDASGRYLIDNEAHLKWHGLEDAQELLGRTVFDFYPEDIATQLHEDDQAVLASGEALVDRDERLMDRTGEVRRVLTTKVPWRGEGSEVLGLVCISRDVTQQRQAEENLREAYEELAKSREEGIVAMGKLQAAHNELRQVQLQLIEAEKMKSIGRLAAGVAHEVKNPLGILKMGVDYLKGLPIPDENSGMVLKEMSDAVMRADHVVRGLLDFSAPRRLELTPADLNTIIEGALKMVRGELQGSYSIERELQPALPELDLDSPKISQVFINLFSNALHAMNGRGTLQVRTYSKQLTGVGTNIGRSETFRVGRRIVVAEIDDTGCGIPEEQLPKVFEPFYTSKPTGAGTGLGLSVARTIIDLHGGTIDLVNRAQGGVRATIMFQVPEAEARA